MRTCGVCGEHVKASANQKIMCLEPIGPHKGGHKVVTRERRSDHAEQNDPQHASRVQRLCGG
jgi:hypothetical protein